MVTVVPEQRIGAIIDITCAAPAINTNLQRGRAAAAVPLCAVDALALAAAVVDAALVEIWTHTAGCEMIEAVVSSSDAIQAGCSSTEYKLDLAFKCMRFGGGM